MKELSVRNARSLIQEIRNPVMKKRSFTSSVNDKIDDAYTMNTKKEKGTSERKKGFCVFLFLSFFLPLFLQYQLLIFLTGVLGEIQQAIKSTSAFVSFFYEMYTVVSTQDTIIHLYL